MKSKKKRMCGEGQEKVVEMTLHEGNRELKQRGRRRRRRRQRTIVNTIAARKT